MKRSLTMIGLTAMILAVGCGPSATARVHFSYVESPSQPLSPEYSKIAVYDATMMGDTNEYDQNKWSKMTADMLRYYLQQARERHGMSVQVVDRQHLDKAAGEQDLADAGLTEDRRGTGSSGFEGVDAVLTSDITVKIDKQRGSGRTVDAMSVAAFAGRAWGGGGGSIRTTEVAEEARNITVSCQFQLKDASGNRMLVTHSSLPRQDYVETNASPFFGSSKTEKNMPPRDKVIGDMIEQHMFDFLGKFVPVSKEFDVEAKSSRHEMSVAGVRALNRAATDSDYQQALDMLKQAIAEAPDDHRSHFAAGVCCEKLGNMAEARRHYKTAESLKPKEGKYAVGAARVANR